MPAVTAAVALGCDVNSTFSFDRKHYFYGDQPAGYQITQHFEPYARGGIFPLYVRDGVNSDVPVRIKQIQIEQDTGKTLYAEHEAKVDLNRTNTCLIELVTEPDIPTPEAAGVFVRKLQLLLRHLNVCSGELESGAMRVDVNVSVNGGQRCEIKNLFSISAVVRAIRAEFRRQVADIKAGKAIQQETRGWDGKNTWKLRGKEDALDYRYMPDPELRPVTLTQRLIDSVRSRLPLLPDDLFVNLLQEPYNVPVVDARTLLGTPGLLDYYHDVVNYFVEKGGRDISLVSKWIVHRLLGEIGNEHIPFAENPVATSRLGDIIVAVDSGSVSPTSGALILKHIVANPEDPTSIQDLVKQFDLQKTEGNAGELEQLCQDVITQNPEVVERTLGSKPSSIKFLVGQVMRASRGRMGADKVEETIKRILGM